LTQATTRQMHLHYQEIAYKTAIAKAYFGPCVSGKGTDDDFAHFGFALGDVAYYSLGPIDPAKVAAVNEQILQ